MGRKEWRLADRTLTLESPLPVGIVNVTSDSMFSGARSETPEAAIADGVALAEAGFEMLDVGAVAARSGPQVRPEQEAAKLAPAIRGLRERGDVPISADTHSAEVAARALEAGAVAINDISGAGDPALFELAAESGCGLVLMHIEGPPREDREPPRYDDPVEHLREWFADRIEAAAARGVDPAQLVLDPGLDFDLALGDDLEILRRLEELRSLERPLYVSLSRKDFLGAVLAGSWEARLPAEEREWATAAATALAAYRGAEIFRLHDESALQALRVAGAIRDPARAKVLDG
ncbi:MAG TPA: dihydropteroate synthase [Solirubrobacterales bacterium]|jgi:dihydropteroate synthase|nr:dihydropteroate synthase [Solirubrobacterales bacterium]